MSRLLTATLALLSLAACSSGTTGSGFTGKRVASGKLPPADLIDATHPVDREIGTALVHRYRVDVPAKHVVRGTVIQDGIDVVVRTFDASGALVKEHDSPNGDKGPEPFVIEAGTAGAYYFEVVPFIEPAPPGAGSAAPPAPHAGRYQARIDQVMTADAYGELAAKAVIDSARILDLWRAVRDHRTTDIEKFWTDLKGTSPIVEPYPGDPNDVLVTFVFRSSMPYVGLVGGPSVREKPLLRVRDSDFWYLTARMPADSRFDYGFIATDGPPPFHTPHVDFAVLEPRFAARLPDPNNPMTGLGMSRVELTAAPPQPWVQRNPEVPAGKVTELTIDSTHVKEKRRIGVYTPPGFDPAKSYPLIVAFDGEAYGLEAAGAPIQLPTVLDNLIAAKKIPPVVAALVANQGMRNRDLTGNEPFSRFVALELVPRLRADYHAGAKPAETIVTGSSFGGLCASFTALHHPEVFGNVLSNSGAFWFRPGQIEGDLSDSVEPGWLIREFVAAPKLAVKFYLDVGRFEGDLLDSNRRLRDVLRAKGYDVAYVEYSGGHDYLVWRGTIADGLMALLPAPAQ